MDIAANRNRCFQAEHVGLNLQKGLCSFTQLPHPTFFHKLTL